MLQLQLQGKLQPGGLTACQVEELQRVGEELASYEADRLAPAA